MTDYPWSTLPAGPTLRRIVAERLGWHIRKIWVGSGGVEYDLFVYDHDDRIAFHYALTKDHLADEQAAVDQAWHEAMEDEDCPRWDEDLAEALDLAYGMDRSVGPEDSMFRAWVRSDEFSATAATEPLAVVRAWLRATDDDPAFFH
ncbi:MAG: hypothetical protein K8J31_05480 [Anaerolineae bacterium]|nr:hypothetical protein [Anaerolineae bacterium]